MLIDVVVYFRKGSIFKMPFEVVTNPSVARSGGEPLLCVRPLHPREAAVGVPPERVFKPPERYPVFLVFLDEDGNLLVEVCKLP